MSFKNRVSGILIILLVVILGQTTWHTESSQLVAKYGSLPKGVILEGEAYGFPKINTIKYDMTNNRFILNKNTFYPCPIPRTQVAAILIALSKDDRLGVSIANRRSIVYGALIPEGEAAKALLQADLVLVSVIFGWNKNLQGITLPNNYQPKVTEHREIPAVSVNKFKGYEFAIRDNTYYLEKMQMINILLPLGADVANDGGYLPGDKLSLLSASDLDNLDEIRDNSRAYIDLPPITKAAKLGEFAAFARYLRNSGNLDLAALAQHVARSY